MDNRVYGYARVSSREQNEDRQLEALTKFGVPEQNIIIDKASGNSYEYEVPQTVTDLQYRPFFRECPAYPALYRFAVCAIFCGYTQAALMGFLPLKF